MEEKYFIASNSSEGFCSYYGKTFDVDNFSGIYIIKGGPGTGKAYFMREAARAAEERGFEVRYIYCSSDAHSLDAIIVKDLKIAIPLIIIGMLPIILLIYFFSQMVQIKDPTEEETNPSSYVQFVEVDDCQTERI